jgi:NitT/TauT family transport system substrate-binding protein
MIELTLGRGDTSLAHLNLRFESNLKDKDELMHYFKLLVILFFILTLVSCGDSPPNVPSDKVNVQLKYLHQAQFAGLYVALEKGYYREENLDVNLTEGGRGMDLVAPVVGGEAHFGIVSSDLILAKRAEGVPIKAIAAIYRRSATSFVSLSDSGIVRPHDMVGKKIAVISKNAREYEFQLRAMLKNLDLDIAEMDLVNLDHQYKGFIEGDIDVTGAYVTGGAMRLQAQGVGLNFIWPSDYGINFYSDTIFTSDSLIEKNSDLVIRFLRATLKGWNEAIRNTEEAVEITMQYAKIKDKELQTKMMEAQHPLIYTGEDQIGWMTEIVWSGMNKVMSEQNIIEKPLSDISTVYTMDFLEEIYSTK